MTEPFKEYTTPDDKYEYDGIEYDDAESFLWCGLFGFCACGPNDRTEIVRKGLAHLQSRSEFWHKDEPQTKEQNDTFYAQWNEEARRIFGNEESRYFFYYWADKEDLTEHGGAIPGWLTDKGEEVLRLLNQIHDASTEEEIEI